MKANVYHMNKNLMKSVHAVHYARQNETLKDILKKILMGMAVIH